MSRCFCLCVVSGPVAAAAVVKFIIRRTACGELPQKPLALFDSPTRFTWLRSLFGVDIFVRRACPRFCGTLERFDAPAAAHQQPSRSSYSKGCTAVYLGVSVHLCICVSLHLCLLSSCDCIDFWLPTFPGTCNSAD